MKTKTNETTFVCACGEAKDSFRALSSHTRASKLPECKTTDLDAMRPVKDEPQEKALEVPMALASEVLEWKPKDRFYIPDSMKEGGFVYRWLSVQYRDRRGMEHWVVVKPEEVPEDFAEDFIQGGQPIDGRLMRGNDMFLARMPIELLHARQRYYAEKNLSRAQAAEASMEAAIGAHGVDDVTFQKFQEDRARPVQKKE